MHSPLREAIVGPFGLTGGSGSHAFVVTRERFIISRDPHQAHPPRSVCQIPFANILSIEVGEALTLGWFVARHVVADNVAVETVFFQSSGIDLFRHAVRLWRAQAVPGAAANDLLNACSDIYAKSPPPYLRNQLVPLILQDERPHAVWLVDECWSRTAALHGLTCAAAPAVCMVSDRGCLLVQRERPPQPGTLVFGVDATCIDRRTLRDIRVAKDEALHAECLTLTLDLETASARHEVRLPVGRAPLAVLERFVADARCASKAMSCSASSSVPILTVAQLIGNGSRVWFNRGELNLRVVG